MFRLGQKVQAHEEIAWQNAAQLRFWVAQRFGFNAGLKHHSETGFTASCHIQFQRYEAGIISQAYISVGLALDLPNGLAGRSEPHHTRSNGRKYLVRYWGRFGERRSSEENGPQSFARRP